MVMRGRPLSLGFGFLSFIISAALSPSCLASAMAGHLTTLAPRSGLKRRILLLSLL